MRFFENYELMGNPVTVLKQVSLRCNNATASAVMSWHFHCACLHSTCVANTSPG